MENKIIYENLKRKYLISKLDIIDNKLSDYENRLCEKLNYYFYECDKKERGYDVVFTSIITEEIHYTLSSVFLHINNLVFWEHFEEFKDIERSEMEILIRDWLSEIGISFEILDMLDYTITKYTNKLGILKNNCLPL